MIYDSLESSIEKWSAPLKWKNEYNVIATVIVFFLLNKGHEAENLQRECFILYDQVWEKIRYGVLEDNEKCNLPSEYLSSYTMNF